MVPRMPAKRSQPRAEAVLTEVAISDFRFRTDTAIYGTNVCGNVMLKEVVQVLRTALFPIF